MIRLATVSVNSGPDPRKRRRNAMPAASETTTVAIITIVASKNERSSRPPKSPTAWVWNRRANQCRERPFIGNVRPPLGP